jgi:hypothetical protein
MDRANLEVASARSRQILARSQRLCRIHRRTGTEQIPFWVIPHSSSQGVLEIRYSYSALGRSFQGRRRLDGSSKFSPDDFTDRLVRLPIQVQYHPDKPSISALLDSSIEALLRQAPPLSPEEEQRIREAHEIPAL